MVKEFFILRTSISSALLRATLIRGFAIAFIGIGILVFAGIYSSVEFLQNWGWSLFLTAIALITLGLLPYRRLSRLQVNPNKMVFFDLNHITYIHKDKKVITIPVESISHMNYLETCPSDYGIAIWLKPSPIEPIMVHQSVKEVEQMLTQAQRIENADLFLPYFNERTYNELREWLFENEED